MLQDGYREKVRLATKLPCWEVKEEADFNRLLEVQMKRLDVDFIDFYLLHGLNKNSWVKVQGLGVLDWAEKQMSEGLFGHLCFSFHDEYPVFESIIKAYDNWTMAQIQYNYADVNYQAGQKGLKLAADRGMAVVVMEPLRGGRIAKNPPPEPVAKVWEKSERDWTPAAWAFNWLWDQPEVSLALSGMHQMSDVEENLALADEAEVGKLTEQDHKLIREARKAYESLAPIPCTQCEYCLPCSSGVKIPTIFEMYNDAAAYDAWGHARLAYNNQLKPEARADQCIECGECEEACPQNIRIIEWLAAAHEKLIEPAK